MINMNSYRSAVENNTFLEALYHLVKEKKIKAANNFRIDSFYLGRNQQKIFIDDEKIILFDGEVYDTAVPHAICNRLNDILNFIKTNSLTKQEVNLCLIVNCSQNHWISVNVKINISQLNSSLLNPKDLSALNQCALITISDSLGQTSYSQNVQNFLINSQLSSSAISYKSVSRQKGYTCGEHSIFNSFSQVVCGKTVEANVDSEKLRTEVNKIIKNITYQPNGQASFPTDDLDSLSNFFNETIFHEPKLSQLESMHGQNIVFFDGKTNKSQVLAEKSQHSYADHDITRVEFIACLEEFSKTLDTSNRYKQYLPSLINFLKNELSWAPGLKKSIEVYGFYCEPGKMQWLHGIHDFWNLVEKAESQGIFKDSHANVLEALNKMALGEMPFP